MNEYWRLASCYDWYEANEKIWFCLTDKNAICEIDKQSGKCYVLGKFPNKPLNQKKVSMAVAEHRGQLVFSPFSADDIAVYDTRKRKFRFYPVQIKSTGKKVIYSEKQKFFRIISYGDYLLLIGRTIPVIVRFCVESGELEYFDEWSKEIDDASQDGCFHAYFSDGYALIEDYLYLGLSCTNGMLKINLKTMEWELKKIECGLSGFGGVLQTKDAIWLSGIQCGENNLVRINLKKGDKDEVKIPYHGRYLSPFYFENKIYLAPITEQKLYWYSIESGRWGEVWGIGRNRSIGGRDNRVIAWKTDEYGFTLITGNDKKWKRFGRNASMIKNYTVEIDDKKFIEEYIQKIIYKNLILENDFSLNAFIVNMEESVNTEKHPFPQEIWKSFLRLQRTAGK